MEKLKDIENIQDMEGLVLKSVEIYVEIQDLEIFQDLENFQDMELFQDMEIFLDEEIFLHMEVKYHTLYFTPIGRRKNSAISHITIWLCTSLKAVNPKPNDLLSVTSLMQFLKN